MAAENHPQGDGESRRPRSVLPCPIGFRLQMASSKMKVLRILRRDHLSTEPRTPATVTCLRCRSSRPILELLCWKCNHIAHGPWLLGGSWHFFARVRFPGLLPWAPCPGESVFCSAGGTAIFRRHPHAHCPPHPSPVLREALPWLCPDPGPLEMKSSSSRGSELSGATQHLRQTGMSRERC